MNQTNALSLLYSKNSLSLYLTEINRFPMLDADKEYMLAKIEEALANACRKEVGATALIRVNLDPVKCDMKVYHRRLVVPDGEVIDPKCEISLSEAKALSRRNTLGKLVETEVKTKNVRRLSAGAAKSVIIQGIREGERKAMQDAYESKREEIITATVSKVFTDNGNVLLDTGTGHATLIKSEQIPGETYREGDHIRVYVLEVRQNTRGPLVQVSRTHPNLVRRLFELETPEIAEGQVEIRNIAREAGSRSKMAVRAAMEGIDPVGACVGPRGGRVGAVVEELHGEKIDIVVFSEDVCEYVRAALSPAEVISVTLLELSSSSSISTALRSETFSR
mgnify:CR=1 FL=1